MNRFSKPACEPKPTPAPVRPPAATTAGWLVTRMLVDGIDGLCVISDVTTVGAKVMSVIPLTVDARLDLDIGEGRGISARVHWVDPTRCGVEFDPPLDGALLTALAAGTAATPRFKRCASVTLERHGRLATAQLLEISPTDACFELAPEPWIREGAEIEVNIEGFFPTEAEVSWIKEARIGVAFRTPIQLWRLDNQLREWARECGACPIRNCHSAPRATLR